jgi:membrane dipeptidase
MRLIDLHCDWLRQYAPELASFDRSSGEAVANRLGELDGYLSTTSAAGLICARTPEEWAAFADPWAALGDMIARYQAEFSGRILMGPDDADRWIREPADGLCWGLIGVRGFDSLILEPSDLDRLPELFARGARMFQPIETPCTRLGGSSEPGDDRGLTDLGRGFLERLTGLGLGLDSDQAGSAPRPVVDLSGMNSATLADVLSWLEADPARLDRVLVVISRGGFEGPRPIDGVTRLRALGGVIGLGVGPPSLGAPDDLAAQVRTLTSVPFRGEIGAGGIAIATDYLGGVEPFADLANVDRIIERFRRTLDRPTADALLFGNGRELFLEAVGADRGMAAAPTLM